MAEEINPRTGKPYSTNPRAVAARKKRAARKSAEAQARAEAERGGEQTSPEELFGEGYTGEPTYTGDNYESPGQKLEKEGGYIDTGELDEQGRPSLMIGDALKKTWDFSKGFLPDPTNFAEMSEHMAGFAMDARAFKTGAMASPVKHPVAMGLTGLGGVVLRRAGAEALKPVISKGQRYVNDMLDGIFSSSRLKPAYEGASQSVYQMSKAGDEIPLSQRMGDAYDANKKIIKNKGSLDGHTGIREIDKFAKVNKTKIRKYVEEFGGTEDDVTRIFNEHVLKQKNINQSRTWLNQYFKKLTSGLGPDGLKDVKIMEVNGVSKLVDGSTEKAIGHAFEVDHSKAKELMASLGLEGADFHENLDIVYTVWNRAKNNIGNPAIYDDVLRATGQSTSLRELVQRSLDKTFDAKFTRVPERFRDLARRQILEDIQAGVTIKGKPSKMRKQIIERHLKFWDDNADIITQMDDYVPEELLNDPDFWADPQQTYESLLNMGVLDSLKPAYKKRVKRMTDQWVKLNRGATAVRDYLERTGGNTIKKKYN